MYTKIILILFSLFFLSGCVPPEKEDPSIEFLLKGRKAFSNKDFKMAIPYFYKVAFSKFNKTDFRNYSLFYLALSYYHLWELDKANTYFHALQKREDGFFINLFKKFQDIPINENIVNIYLDVIKGNPQKGYIQLKNIIDTLEKEKKGIAPEQLFIMHHILFLGNKCRDYYTLGEIMKNYLREAKGPEAQTLLNQPIFGISAVECLVVNNIKSKDKRGKNELKRIALKLIDKIDNAKNPAISPFFGSLLNGYRLLLKEDYSSALHFGNKMLKKNLHSEIISFMVRLYQSKGDFWSLGDFISKYRNHFKNEPVDQYNLASYLAAGGQVNDALAVLENSVKLGFRDLAHMNFDPDMEPLRYTNRYKTILKTYFKKSTKGWEGNK